MATIVQRMDNLLRDDPRAVIDARPAPPYDEFLYHFAAALRGRYDDEQPLREPTLPKTIGEAFRYARAWDRAPETPLLSDPAGIAHLTWI